MERPHRAYELDIHIGADNWEEVVREMRRVCEHVEDHGEKCKLVSGGPDSGATVEIAVRPEMTHEQYIAELTAYMDHREREK